ncbi:MAG: glycosyltransferase family 4 protein [Pyrinomonadaceae bacterium]
MKPSAIVCPWFGRDLTGGAEQQAFQLATRLAARGHNVEVLTTCNRSFHADWSINHHAPGAHQEHGLTIRRFPVEPRNTHAFDEVNALLLALDPATLRPGVNSISAADAHTFEHENIKSAALLDFLRAERESYHAFIFLPYMFAPATLGAPLVADHAWLQPCLHDEPAAYLPQTARLFRRVRALLFNSEGELELALRLYGPGIYSRSTVVGEGIERTHYTVAQLNDALPAALRGARFVLYLGRRDQTKNVNLLTRAFAQFKAMHPASELQLVLAGPGAQSFAAGADVHDLGLVADEIKAALIAHCRALAQPSRNESFSRAMMEAWAAERPVAAHRACLATAGAVERAQGGWLAADEAEWAQLFARIDETAEAELRALGARGRAYADEQADWAKVIARYEALLELGPQQLAPVAHASVARAPHVIHQLLPDIVYGDAVSNHARAIRAELRRRGYESEIFVKRRDERLPTEACLFAEAQPAPADCLLYHHSIGSELTAFAVAHRGPKCLVYHNVTPADFYAPYRPGFAWLLETGRANLARLARHFPTSAGVSAFNAAELRACGFREPGVLPLIIDPDLWNIAPDDDLMARLQDGRTNILFVGRVAPNKRLERLVELFAHYRKLDPTARLIIAGEGRASDPYLQHLVRTIMGFELTAHVELPGTVADAALLAYYRTAHLYLSLSEHEGFGAPLVEALWFDVPVLALAAAAVPETLGRAGALFTPDDDFAAVAAHAYQLTHAAELRRRIIATQRTRRLDFTPAAVWPHLARLIEQATSARAALAGMQS